MERCNALIPHVMIFSFQVLCIISEKLGWDRASLALQLQHFFSFFTQMCTKRFMNMCTKFWENMLTGFWFVDFASNWGNPGQGTHEQTRSISVTQCLSFLNNYNTCDLLCLVRTLKLTLKSCLSILPLVPLLVRKNPAYEFCLLFVLLNIS